MAGRIDKCTPNGQIQHEANQGLQEILNDPALASLPLEAKEAIRQSTMANAKAMDDSGHGLPADCNIPRCDQKSKHCR